MFTDIDLEHPFVHQRMNLETSQLSAPVTSDNEISTSHPIVGESLPSSFHHILTGPADTNPTMSCYVSAGMASSTPPPFTYPISSNSGISSPSTVGASNGPSSSSLNGSGTKFHFGMGSSSILGLGVSSTTTTIISTSNSIPATFSLCSTPIVHNVPSRSQSKASLSSMGQPLRTIPRSIFCPLIDNPSFSQNLNVGFPYGWNWTSSAPVGSQTTSSSYSGFGQNLGSFNPPRSPHIGGISGPFHSTPMGAGSSPHTQGVINVSFQKPPFRPRKNPNMSNQSIPMVPMGKLYQMDGYQSMPPPYPRSSPYPPTQYMGGDIWPIWSQYHATLKPKPICEYTTTFLGYSRVS